MNCMSPTVRFPGLISPVTRPIQLSSFRPGERVQERGGMKVGSPAPLHTAITRYR